MSNQFQGLIKIVKHKPDFIIAPYDREELITMAIAGVYLNIPVVHLGAGEKTSVNVDGAVRHSVSKLSHIFLHFLKKQEKVNKVSEEKWRILM